MTTRTGFVNSKASHHNGLCRPSRVLVAFGISLICAALPGNAAQLNGFTQGNWFIAAYTDDESGNFTHCSGTVLFLSGINLSVAVYPNYSWAIAIGGPNWDVKNGDEYDFSISIDGSSFGQFKGMALVGAPAILISLPNDDRMIRAFRSGRTMQIVGNSFSVPMDLSGTSRLLMSLADCVGRHAGSAPLPNNVPVPQPVAPSAPVASRPPEPAKPSEAISPSTPKVGDSGPSIFSGTGVLVGGAIALTNNHVVRDCTQFAVRLPDGTKTSAEVVATDAANDLALLRLDGHSAEVAAHFRVTPQPSAGEQVAVFGFPFAGILSSSGNIVSGNISALSGLGDDTRYYQITAPIQSGNSGGPLLDYMGNVIGIVNMKMDELASLIGTGNFPQNINFAIKSTVVSTFLDANHVTFSTNVLSEGVDITKVAEVGREISAFIVCQ